MTYPTLSPNTPSTVSYSTRIDYGAKVFGITLRLGGVVLLLVQIAQAVIAIVNGGGISVNIAIGCTIAVLLILASRKRTIRNAVTKFAGSIHSRRFSLYVYLIPFFLSALILFAKSQIGPITDEWRYVSSEGSLSEYGTAIAYLLVPVFAYPMAKLFRRQNQRLMASFYYLLIAAAFFVGMEEISWGQRLLGYEEPEFWSKHNVQSEFTFHNFAFFQKYLLHNSFILVGFLGSVCWVALRYWQSRQKKVVPGQQPTVRKLNLSYLLPDWPVSSFFYPVFIFYTLITYTAYGRSGVFLHSVDQEHWEFVMSLGVLLFVVINFFRQVAQGRSAEASQRASVHDAISQSARD